MLSQQINDLFTRTIEEIDRLGEETDGEKTFSVLIHFNGQDYYFHQVTENGLQLVEKQLVYGDFVWCFCEDCIQHHKGDIFLHLDKGTENYDIAALLIARNDIVEV